jgi:hypothetical protein
MWVDEGKTAARGDVLGDEGLKERGLSDSRFPYDVQVRESVCLLNSKAPMGATCVRDREIGHVGRCHCCIIGFDRQVGTGPTRAHLALDGVATAQRTPFKIEAWIACSTPRALRKSQMSLVRSHTFFPRKRCRRFETTVLLFAKSVSGYAVTESFRNVIS